ncbi:helix-turn-helix transcriptional regulator [Dehalococcoides mccartyi]|uniref:helix-turn-helix transcriptional regulator n=1 Tax=Dehalococcoides mccartyi TaxID=61435 RepID=UPI003D80DC14
MATIKELRLRKLWSQAKLAMMSGVSRTTIVAIENNQHTPQPLTIHKLAKALEVEPNQIDQIEHNS